MADEITSSVNIGVNKNGVIATLSKAITATLAGDKIFSNTQAVGATAETILLGEIADPQFIYIENLSSSYDIVVILNSEDVILLKAVGTGITWAYLPTNTGVTKQFRCATALVSSNALVIAAGA